jgi:hypothetical protein
MAVLQGQEYSEGMDRRRGIGFITTFYCTPDKQMIGKFHADYKDTLSSTLGKAGMPLIQIMEATKKI